MRIQNLNASRGAAAETAEGTAAAPSQAQPATASPASQDDRRTLEIALLKARIQHLELIVETARSLMGANQERLLRQLHEVPREITAISAQLRRADPQGSW